MSQSNQIDLEMIRQLAKLSRFSLTSQEETLYQKELSMIVEFVQELQSVDLSEEEPIYQVGDLVNATRDDQCFENDPHSWPKPDQLLNSFHQAQLTDDGHLRVPKII